LKYEKTNLIHIQIKDYLLIFTHKIHILNALTTFLKKCEKGKESLYIKTDGAYIKLLKLQKRLWIVGGRPWLHCNV